MRERTALLLSGLAIVLLLLAAAFAAPPDLAPEPARPMFPDLAAHLAEATRIVMAHGTQTATLARDGGVWRVTEKAQAPADDARVAALLDEVAGLQLIERRTADPERLRRLGLDGPTLPDAEGVSLVVSGAGGEMASFVSGHLAGADAIYVRRATQNQAWLAHGRPAVSTDPRAWLAPVLAVPPGDVVSVSVRRAGETLSFRREDGHLVAAGPHPPLDPAKVEAVGSALAHLAALDAVPAAQVPGARLARTSYVLADGSTLDLDVFASSEDLWVIPSGGSPEAAGNAARVAGLAFHVAHELRPALAPSLDALLAYPPAARAP